MIPLIRYPKILIAILVILLLSIAFTMLVIQPRTFFNKPPFPVPESARWIRYKGWSMWVGFEEWARFSAPREDCVSAAEAILEQWRQENPMSGDEPTVVGKTAITASENRTIDGPWWFAPHSINHGYVVGATNVYAISPVVWVDSDRGIVYYHFSD